MANVLNIVSRFSINLTRLNGTYMFKTGSQSLFQMIYYSYFTSSIHLVLLFCLFLNDIWPFDFTCLL